MSSLRISSRRSLPPSCPRENRPQNRPKTPSDATEHECKSRSPDRQAHVEPKISHKRKRQNVALAPSIAPASSHGVSARLSRAAICQDDSPSARGPRCLPHYQKEVLSFIQTFCFVSFTRLVSDISSKRKEQEEGRRRTNTRTWRMQERGYTGSLAQRDFTRMKEELEKLNKVRFPASAARLILTSVLDCDRQVSEGILTPLRRYAEGADVSTLYVSILSHLPHQVVSSIEQNLNCQICMEILLRPFG